ncbi:RxLR effector protein, partial [Phytophthora megakarya]
SCYNKGHYKAAQRVLKYLKGTSTYGLIFDGKSKEVIYELYTDASFANANENRKSVTGYVSIMADACITWKSSRQSTVSLHTAQAELIAASEGVKESE